MIRKPMQLKAYSGIQVVFGLSGLRFMEGPDVPRQELMSLGHKAISGTYTYPFL